MSILQLRLKNCLLTLLELKPCMRDNQKGFFESDFAILQNCLERVDHIDLLEEEIALLENYTSAFLMELGRGEKWKLKRENLQ